MTGWGGGYGTGSVFNRLQTYLPQKGAGQRMDRGTEGRMEMRDENQSRWRASIGRQRGG